MHKIQYKDIADDKDNIIEIINKMIPIYKKLLYHTQVLECEQWIIMINRIPIQTTYTSDAILALKCIMNDCANIYLSYGDVETGTVAMNLMNKLFKLFKENKNEKD